MTIRTLALAAATALLAVSATVQQAAADTVTRCNVVKSPKVFARKVPEGELQRTGEITGYLVDVHDTTVFKGKKWANVMFDSFDINQGCIEYKYLTGCHSESSGNDP